MALFAGLNAVPKRSYLAGYSSRVGPPDQTLRSWVHGRGDEAYGPHTRFLRSILDFHTVSCHTENRSKSTTSQPEQEARRASWFFLAPWMPRRDWLCYANAGVSKAEQAGEILRFVAFWQKHTGSLPREAGLDSQLTTYEHLNELNRKRNPVHDLRRRSRKMLGLSSAGRQSAWRSHHPQWL